MLRAALIAVSVLPATLDIHLDRHAVSSPTEAERSLDSLADYLFQPVATDRDKARIIFRWITEHISHDTDALYTAHPGDLRPDVVLRTRKARGAGYAALFDDLARRGGLKSKCIPGCVKGMSVKDDDDFAKPFQPNHTWNAVKINGCWQLLDTACGAGFIKGQRFHKQFGEQFFLTPPSQLIWTHYPADPAWQLLPRPLTFEQFTALTPVKVGFFRLGLVQKVNLPDKGKPAVQPYSSTSIIAQAGAVRLLEGPVELTLSPRRDYHFLIEAPNAIGMELRNNQLRFPLRKIGTRFETTIRPEEGDLRLIMQTQLRPGQNQLVVTYRVQ